MEKNLIVNYKLLIINYFAIKTFYSIQHLNLITEK
jgi:hypothetical protein